MPTWMFIPLVLVAGLACPISMWVMGRVRGRRMSCAACDTTAPGEVRSPVDLETRKAAVEREIGELNRQIEAGSRTHSKAGSGAGRG